MAKGLWKELQHQRLCFDIVGKQLKLKSFDDWYNITQEDINQHGGRKVLSCYNGSPVNALLSIYPDFDWIIWKFKCVPQGFWKDKMNQKKFFDWVGKKLGIKSFEDWYNI